MEHGQNCEANIRGPRERLTKAAKPMRLAKLLLHLQTDMVMNPWGVLDHSLEAASCLLEQHLLSYSPSFDCAKEKVKVIQTAMLRA